MFKERKTGEESGTVLGGGLGVRMLERRITTFPST